MNYKCPYCKKTRPVTDLDLSENIGWAEWIKNDGKIKEFAIFGYCPCGQSVDVFLKVAKVEAREPDGGQCE